MIDDTEPAGGADARDDRCQRGGQLRGDGPPLILTTFRGDRNQFLLHVYSPALAFGKSVTL